MDENICYFLRVWKFGLIKPLYFSGAIIATPTHKST